MGTKNPRADTYIYEAAPFAQPILDHLRALVHQTCPETTEAIKWGHLFFEYAGGNLCMLAAFKHHCAFGFWLESKMDDPDNILKRGKVKNGESPLAGITSLKDLPSNKILKQYIQKAMSLLESGVKLSRPKPATRTATAAATKLPPDLTAALKANKKAGEFFSSFSPSAKKEYIEWLTEAKTEATRDKRLATAIEWIAEGKTRHWKYK
ncbi:MAG: hypothetical protein JWO03_108 [Bacteroidetes bacterium]|nr:hypothetical protein [Bacteroidota bacterium]